MLFYKIELTYSAFALWSADVYVTRKTEPKIIWGRSQFTSAQTAFEYANRAMEAHRTANT